MANFQVDTGIDDGGRVDVAALSHALDKSHHQARRTLSTALTASLDPEEDQEEQPTGLQGFFDEPKIGRDWEERRKMLAQIFTTAPFSVSLGTLIMFSLVIVVVETDAHAVGKQVPWWSRTCSWILVTIYGTELCFRIYVFRGRFFCHFSNILDLFTVVGDSINLCFDELGVYSSSVSFLWLRFIRMLRLGRAVQVILMFPELRLMLQSLWGAAKVIFWGVVLLMASMLIWSVLAVQLLNDLTKELSDAGVFQGCARCPHAFESTFSALVTLTQTLLAGDSWGLVAIPLIEAHPWTYAFFILCIASISIAILNLILALFVDTALQTRSRDEKHMKSVKDEELMRWSRRLFKLFADLDVNKDGVLSYEELVTAFEENDEFFTIMSAMDISAQDLETVFSIMDADRTGEIEYVEFVEQLHKMRCGDSHTLLVFIRCLVAQIREGVFDIKDKQSSAARAAWTKFRGASRPEERPKEPPQPAEQADSAPTSPASASETDDVDWNLDADGNTLGVQGAQQTFDGLVDPFQPRAETIAAKQAVEIADAHSAQLVDMHNELADAIRQMAVYIEEIHASQLAALGPQLGERHTKLLDAHAAGGRSTSLGERSAALGERSEDASGAGNEGHSSNTSARFGTASALPHDKAASQSGAAGTPRNSSWGRPSARSRRGSRQSAGGAQPGG